MIESDINKCPSCNNKKTKFFLSGYDRLGHDNRKLYTFVKCDSCNLIYMNPMPGINEINKFYPKNYWWGAIGNSFKEKILAKLREILWIDIIKSLKKYHPANGSLLDVGCGSGTFLKVANKSGFNVMGVEQSKSPAAYIRENLGFEVIDGWIEDIDETLSFDVITLFHVLEHLSDPSFVLIKLYKKLKPGGIIIIEVPNIKSWGFLLMKNKWEGLDIPRHLIHFQYSSLETMLLKCGYNIIHSRFFTFKNGIAILSNSLSHGILRKENWFTKNILFEYIRITLNVIFRFISLPIVMLEYMFGNGEVIFIVAKKTK